MDGRDHSKRDMNVAYGNRTFALRAYREGGAWHGVIIENKTPMRNGLPPAADPAAYFAAAIELVVSVVDASIGLSGGKSS